jgi:uncharacterized protein
MRTYERNGVHVEQCSDCRGLFLDRGELERLVEAEGSFYSAPAAGSPAPPPPPQREEHHHHQSDYGGYDYRGKHYKKRKKNFLEELFD